MERKTLEKMLANSQNDLLCTMQAAWIEWKHGRGAEEAMQWIENTLDGPGLIPDENEPYGKEAQAWMDKNRADPLPECFCGRPSNIGWMGQGFCSEEHYRQAKAQQQPPNYCSAAKNDIAPPSNPPPKPRNKAE